MLSRVQLTDWSLGPAVHTCAQPGDYFELPNTPAQQLLPPIFTRYLPLLPGSLCQSAREHAKKLHSCPTLCDPMDCGPPDSSIRGFPRQEYWSESSFPTLGDLPNAGIEPASLASPALASGFFIASATWEDQEEPATNQLLFPPRFQNKRSWCHCEPGGPRPRFACITNSPHMEGALIPILQFDSEVR